MEAYAWSWMPSDEIDPADAEMAATLLPALIEGAKRPEEIERTSRRKGHRASAAWNGAIYAASKGRGAKAMLTADEERELVTLWQTNGCHKALTRIVNAHFPLIVRMARHHFDAIGGNVSGDPVDYMNQGFVGFIEGLGRFSLEVGVRVATFCQHYVKSAMMAITHTMSHPFRVARNFNEKKAFTGLARASAQFRAETGFEPGIEDAARLSEIIGCSEAAVARTMQLRASRPIEADRIQIAARDTAVDAMLARVQIADMLSRAIDGFALGLTDRDARVLRVLTDLGDPRPEHERMTALAAEFGLTVERIRQLRRAMMAGLRTRIVEAGFDLSAELA